MPLDTIELMCYNGLERVREEMLTKINIVGHYDPSCHYDSLKKSKIFLVSHLTLSSRCGSIKL